jgi:hypothetical protein
MNFDHLINRIIFIWLSEFLSKNYFNLKTLNPNFPILVRDTTEPVASRVYALYGNMHSTIERKESFI